jgi:hypothetical protein
VVALFSKLFGRGRSVKANTEVDISATAAGWAFIEALFAEVYAGQVPKHAAPRIDPKYDLRPSRPPIAGTHVYDGGDAWHYVTLGLTDLYEKSETEVESTGIRCELSMRVAKRALIEPPLWPVAFLGTIATHVSGGALLAQAVSFRTGPIDGAPPDARLEGAVALLDPAIKPRKGPFGKVGVMLLVGLTSRQLTQIKDGGGAALIDEIAADPTKLIT